MPGADPPYPPEALLGKLVQQANVLGLGFGAQWFGVKWSRAVGMLLCHCGLARRLALKLYGCQETSVREFRNPEPAADLGSAEPGVL